MKNVSIILLLWLSVLPAYAQKGLQTIPSSPIPSDLNSLALSEGRPYFTSASGTITQTVATSAVLANSDGTTTYKLTGANLGAIRTGLGETVFISGVAISGQYKMKGSFSTNVTYIIDTQMPPDAFGGLAFTAGGSSGTYSIAASGPVQHQSQLLNGSISEVTLPYATTATSVTFTYEVSVAGTVIYGDPNHSATFVGELWGNSIPKGVGATSDATSIETYIRNYFYGKGYNFRTRNRAISGSTTTQLVYRAKMGDFRKGRRPAVVFIDATTNDMGIGSGVTTAIASATANIKTLVDEALLLSPVTKVVVIATPPRNNTTFEANNVLMRAAMQTAFASYNARVVYAAAVGSAWSATDGSFYIAETPQTHPNDTGTAAYFAALKLALDPFIGNYGTTNGLVLIPYR